MTNLAWQLLAILADAKAHSVAWLCQVLETNRTGLLELVKELPESTQHLLEQRGDFWQLAHTLTVLPQNPIQDEAWFKTQKHRLQVINQHPSSNQYLLDEARLNPDSVHKRVIFVNDQRQGRGRQGREWCSQVGHSLTFSIGWLITQKQDCGALPLVIALAIQQVLKKVGVPVSIKWPNDLMIETAKLGGILVESIPSGHRRVLVMGVGLNFRAVEQPDNRQVASISDYLEHIDVAQLIKQLLDNIFIALRQYFRLGFSYFQLAYMEAHRDQNQAVCLLQSNEQYKKGVAVGVDNSGRLLLIEENGTLYRATSGDISLRREVELQGSTVIQPALNDKIINAQSVFFDAGNSRLKWAWFIGDNMIATFQAGYSSLLPLGEFFRHVPYIKKLYGSAVCGERKKILLSSFVPNPIMWLGSMQHACGIQNHYQNIHQHGSDRWFNILGVRHFTRHACVVVSCGTAVTIDALTLDNQYLGGDILPGFNLMRESLANGTAHLKCPSGQAYPFAMNTANAIASGMMDAVIGAVLLMHARLKQYIGNQGIVDILLTGGGSAKIYRHFPSDFLLDNHVKIVDNLVIFGLKNWVDSL